MSTTEDPIRLLTRLVAESGAGAGPERVAAATAEMLERARALRDEGHGRRITYSRKVFIPLTRLCRDVCHYCTFATTPHALPSPFLSEDEVLAIARAGRDAGCDEALFTLGDKPELRWPEARAFLDRTGHASTIDYLATMCRRVLDETGLLPHANPGVMSPADIAKLRQVSVSQGLMLESTSQRLCERGGPHFGSPDKMPAARLATIAAAAAKTPADTYPAIREALATIGDKQGLLIEPSPTKLPAAPKGQATGMLVLAPDAIVVQVVPGSPAATSTVLVPDTIS